MQTESLWKRKEVSRLMPVEREGRLPISPMKSSADRLYSPKVPIATGRKIKELGSPAYFRVLRSAACSAAEPPNEARRSMYEAAQLWATVASHARYLRCDHGISVTPSGLLPSDLNRPRGSLVLGTPAFTRACHMMSLMAKWRCDRPWDFLHTSPWWPSGPTSAPQ